MHGCHRILAIKILPFCCTMYPFLVFKSYGFLFVCFKPMHSIWKFPGQGSNLSQSCDLCHSSGNGTSLTHYATAGPPKRLWFLKTFAII